MFKNTLLALILLLISNLQAQKNFLKAGPMLGYVEYREACVWAQTTTAATLQVKYWKNLDSTFLTEKVQTNAGSNYTAKLIFDKIEPGNTYSYQILINNKPATPQKTYSLKVPALWRWRTDPPTVKFASGSCHYANETVYDRPGTPYGDTLPGIFNSIVNKQPDFMLWLGDNIYLREPDWHSKTGIYKRYDHSRSNAELNNLLSACPNYAIWDDHDFGPNNSDRGFWNKETTLQIFKQYWANPGFGVNGLQGITTFFNNGDADFFLMDDRYYRTPEGTPETEAEILGAAQTQWLKDNLLGSEAKFKFVAVGSQFLNTSKAGESFMESTKERDTIISFIQKNKIQNVIFLTGDRHHSEISMLKTDSLPSIYDITVSPLTSGAGTWATKENNTLRVEGSLIVGKRNFATLEITGPRKQRKLTIVFFGREGEELYRYQIEAQN
jgi:alkaline phosphatase D